MCGRFTFTNDIFDYVKAFNVTLADTYKYFDFDDADYITSSLATLTKPRYNIAPTQYAPVIVSDDEGATREMAFMRWGLVPSWSKDAAIGSKMINARAETLHEKPGFRNALAERRCLVPADGFYEWKADTIGTKKQPVRFVLKNGEPFAFAGLWEKWKMPGSDGILNTFTIITTQANDFISEWHNRMPAILTPETASIWLREARGWDNNYGSILVPFPSDKMNAFEVSTRVNSPYNDDAELIRPLQR